MLSKYIAILRMMLLELGEDAEYCSMISLIELALEYDFASMSDFELTTRCPKAVDEHGIADIKLALEALL